MWIVLLVILSQSLDTYSTCNLLNKGGYKELNPIMGNTCRSVIIRKSLIVTPLIIWNNKYINIGLISGGLIGFTWNITRH